MKSPAPALSLGDLCRQAARRWPQRTALSFDATGEQFSFAELDGQSTRLAHALSRLGVQPGDRVAVVAGNRPVFALAWLAIAKAGAAMVPVNPAYRAGDAQHLLSHAGVKLAVADRACHELLREARARVPSLAQLVIDDAGPELRPGEHRLQALMQLPPGDDALPRVSADALANVQFTSGTTGLPKGCMLSHRYWTELGRLIADRIVGLGPEDVMLTAQPFSYIDPQWNLAAALSSGARLVVLERFSPSRLWPKVVEHGTTFFYCLGAMPTLLLAQPPSAEDRVHRLRVVMCSGIPPGRHAELEARFGVPWREVYGTTETGADLMVHADMADALRGSGSIGLALPHREVRIGDEQARPLPSGATGELLIRGTGMMDGYFDDDAATLAAFERGWYHTGDLATMDERGCVRIVGRKKDMIRRSGENISAAEVEAVIEQHPAVLTAAVIAVPDALRGEEAKAYVVLRPGPGGATVFDPESLAGFVSERLARFKVPRFWECLDELPRTPSERAAKHVLAAMPAGPTHRDITA
jgi:crotonobetaine/carnitine-CoA ligase